MNYSYFTPYTLGKLRDYLCASSLLAYLVTALNVEGSLPATFQRCLSVVVVKAAHNNQQNAGGRGARSSMRTYQQPIVPFK
eukprot:scaffold10496_cov32-Cyclotella_meneghiniana.AAC.1